MANKSIIFRGDCGSMLNDQLNLECWRFVYRIWQGAVLQMLRRRGWCRTIYRRLQQRPRNCRQRNKQSLSFQRSTNRSLEPVQLSACKLHAHHRQQWSITCGEVALLARNSFVKKFLVRRGYVLTKSSASRREYQGVQYRLAHHFQ